MHGSGSRSRASVLGFGVPGCMIWGFRIFKAAGISGVHVFWNSLFKVSGFGGFRTSELRLQGVQASAIRRGLLGVCKYMGIGVPYFGVAILRILLFRVLY